MTVQLLENLIVKDVIFEEERAVFHTTTDQVFAMEYYEMKKVPTVFKGTTGELTDFIGYPILRAKQLVSVDSQPSTDIHNITFEFQTEAGCFSIHWLRFTDPGASASMEVYEEGPVEICEFFINKQVNLYRASSTYDSYYVYCSGDLFFILRDDGYFIECPVIRKRLRKLIRLQQLKNVGSFPNSESLIENFSLLKKNFCLVNDSKTLDKYAAFFNEPLFQDAGMDFFESLQRTGKFSNF